MCVSKVHLHHGGNRMNPVHVPHEALCQISYTQTDGPVSVTLQFDHLIGTERHIDTTLDNYKNQKTTWICEASC